MDTTNATTTVPAIPVSWQMRREEGGLRAASATHLAQVDRGDVRNGSFPLLCGRWAPDGFDAVVSAGSTSRLCGRCRKAQAAGRLS